MMTKAMEALNDLVGIHVCAFPPGVETICGFTIHDLDKKHNLILAALEENAKLKEELDKYKTSYEQLKKIGEHNIKLEAQLAEKETLLNRCNPKRGVELD